jgi:hypothetical protein
LYVDSLTDEIIFKIWIKDYFMDQSVGWACVKISSLCINKGGKYTFDLFYDDSIVGTLTLLTVFTPY